MPSVGYLGAGRDCKKVGDLEDWTINKVGDRRFGSKMRAGKLEIFEKNLSGSRKTAQKV